MTNDISRVGSGLQALSEKSGAEKTEGEQSLSSAFVKIFEETAQNIQKADQAVLQANSGGKADLHEVMIAMEKADISLRLLVQVRNKAVDAYKEIMRMQV
ncbi:MAG: flagellar hook-basal body complex protein FliE [Desulfohalobiaceae bacterium]|nr:flagellar hook-basal body complex protein FliE [Desulfohalobiaceae bacterium]